MDPRLRPVAVGAVAGVLLWVLPGGLGPVIVVAAALFAGWVLPSEPMTAAVLFLLPTVVVGAIRALIDADTLTVGPLVLALVMTVFVVAIFTHVGAGIALRRQQS